MIDGIIIFMVIITAFTGYKIGGIRFSTVYVTWCGSFAASFFLAPLLSNYLQSVLQVQELWLFIISFIALFLLTFALLSVACSWWLFYTKKTTHTHWLNRTSGVLIGMLTGLILSALCYHIISASYWKEGNDQLKASTIASVYATEIGTDAQTWVNNTLASAEGLQVAGVAITNEKESFQTNSFTTDSNKAMELLQLVNEERKLMRLPLLQMNDELIMAAQFHGADMFTRGYFSHNTPEGKDPFHRLNTLKITYKYAGENLAYSYSIVRAHAALMKSPGHRANILNPKFSKIGISVLDGGSKGLMVVQEFKN